MQGRHCEIQLRRLGGELAIMIVISSHGEHSEYESLVSSHVHSRCCRFVIVAITIVSTNGLNEHVDNEHVENMLLTCWGYYRGVIFGMI